MPLQSVPLIIERLIFVFICALSCSLCSIAFLTELVSKQLKKHLKAFTSKFKLTDVHISKFTLYSYWGNSHSSSKSNLFQKLGFPTDIDLYSVYLIAFNHNIRIAAKKFLFEV